MLDCKLGDTHVTKGVKLSLNQCPRNDFNKTNKMQTIPYASAVGSLMHAQICTCLDIMYIVGVFDRNLINLKMDH